MAKGPFKPTDFPGRKAMSKSHPLDKTSGRMSGAHGVAPVNKSNNMNQRTGGYMIGSRDRQMGNTLHKTAGKGRGGRGGTNFKD